MVIITNLRDHYGVAICTIRTYLYTVSQLSFSLFPCLEYYLLIVVQILVLLITLFFAAYTSQNIRIIFHCKDTLGFFNIRNNYLLLSPLKYYCCIYNEFIGFFLFFCYIFFCILLFFFVFFFFFFFLSFFCFLSHSLLQFKMYEIVLIPTPNVARFKYMGYLYLRVELKSKCLKCIRISPQVAFFVHLNVL